jgi:hypothetical protein
MIVSLSLLTTAFVRPLGPFPTVSPEYPNAGWVIDHAEDARGSGSHKVREELVNSAWAVHT